VTFGSGNTSIVVSGQGVNNGLGATSVPLRPSCCHGALDQWLDGGLYPRIAGRQVSKVTSTPGAATYRC